MTAVDRDLALLCACGHPNRRHTQAFGCDLTACGCNIFRDSPTAEPAEQPSTPRTAPTVVRAPTPATVSLLCACGHGRELHTAACKACRCGGYRTGLPTAPPRAADDPRVLIAAGKRSGNQRITSIAHRVEADLAKLLELLRAERAQTEERELAARRAAEARAEISRLEAQLAAAKAKLRGKPAPRAAAPVASVDLHACPVGGCDRTFESTQAVAMHRRRAHEGYDPAAAAKAGA